MTAEGCLEKGLFRFWDVSMERKMSALDGQQLEPEEIADVCRGRAGKSSVDFRSWFSDRPLLDFDPLARRKASRWESSLRTVIFAFSGQVASRDEIRHGRQVIDCLSPQRRKAIEPADVLGLLGPLLIGFRMSRRGEFVQEANRHRDMTAVLQRLLDPGPLDIEIPLCAHRAPRSTEPRRLATNPDDGSARRALALVRLIADNSRVGFVRATLRQQTATERASACMFPSVFLDYLERGRLGELIDTMNQHEYTVRRLAADYSDHRVTVVLEPLDELSLAAEDDLASEHGEDWWRTPDARFTDLLERPAAPRSTALLDAMRHVERFMPELGRIAADSGQPPASNASAEKKAEHWFRRRAATTATGKALFEVAFYRRWAIRTRAANSLGLGFDRDWSRYQRDAWLTAYGDDPDQSIPLLYARRNPHPDASTTLRRLSYRQFWLPGRAESAA
ncbi:hypothetical protein [Cryptosporangium sp. NPDC051539]|uniref:hypothetical protein n=1 Tax=Cryptosporangium sp. NPDC051539 TaxID=3363962 RepID=UPI0037B2373D